jgi:hypothetical protein
MTVPLVIDTCAMRDSGFRNWLYAYRGRKILPVIAYVETSIYFISRGKTQAQVKQLMKRLGLDIEPLEGQSAHTMVESIMTAGIAPGSGPFYKMWRDHAIAGHAHTAPLTMVTYNVKDFDFLGDRVLTPQDAMNTL